MRGSQKAFTIVELLIVVVVVAVLATIATAVFNGVQQRSRDSQRVSHMNSIKKVLEMYKLQNGTYPLVAYSGLGSAGGWETSAREASGQFIADFSTYGLSGGTPVDPVNNATGATVSTERSGNRYTYAYHRYAAGSNGCDVSRGAYYVLAIVNAEGNSGGSVFEGSPGFSCSTRDWGNEFDWVTGGYER